MIVARYLHRYNDDTRPVMSMESFCYQCNSNFFPRSYYGFYIYFFLRFCSPVCVCVCFGWFCIFHVRVPRSVVSWHDRVGFGVWAVPYREFKTFPKEGCSLSSVKWNSKEDPFTRTDYWMLLFLIINYYWWRGRWRPGSFSLIKTSTFWSSIQITTIKRVRLRMVFLLLGLFSDNPHTLEGLL